MDNDMHDTTQAQAQAPNTKADAATAAPDHVSESEAVDIYERLTEPEDYSRVFVFSGKGETLRFDAEPINDRQERWEYLSKLPGVSSSDPEDLDTGAIKPDGEAIEAIEDMTLASFSHPHYSPKEMENIVRNVFNDEVLFECFSEIVEMSTDLGAVDDFRTV